MPWRDLTQLLKTQGRPMDEPTQNPSFHASKVPPRLMAEVNLWPKQYGTKSPKPIIGLLWYLFSPQSNTLPDTPQDSGMVQSINI